VCTNGGGNTEHFSEYIPNVHVGGGTCMLPTYKVWHWLYSLNNMSFNAPQSLFIIMNISFFNYSLVAYLIHCPV